MGSAASQPLLVGVDLGTSAAKAMVVDAAGRAHGRARAAYPLRRARPTWAEQAPDDWWDAVCRAVRQATAGVERRSIAALALSGQLNAVVLLDATGQPLRDALVWLDVRAASEAAWLRERFGEAVRAATYASLTPINALPKLMWVRLHEPASWQRARHYLPAKDYVNFRLTGELAAELTDLCVTALLDIRTGTYSRELLDAAEIPPSLLPRIVASTDVVGRLSPEAARALDLAEGTPVVAGAGDMAALAVGTGVTRPGTACATIATAGHVAAFLEGLPAQGDDRLWLMLHPIPGRYFWHGMVMNAGDSLAFFRRTLGQVEEHAGRMLGMDAFDLLTAQAADSPPGSRGLVYLPFLNGAATPYNDPHMKGGFVGLTAGHRRSDFVRAVLEGVAYNFRQVFDVLAELGADVRDVYVGEGGSRSTLWRSILADVLGRPLLIVEEVDAASLGAALVAGVGVGVWPNFEVAGRQAVRVAERVDPDPHRQQRYQAIYGVYAEACRSLRPLGRLLEELPGEEG